MGYNWFEIMTYPDTDGIGQVPTHDMKVWMAFREIWSSAKREAKAWTDTGPRQDPDQLTLSDLNRGLER